MNLFTGRNRDADVENGLVDIAREEGRTNREKSIDIHITMYKIDSSQEAAI